MALSRVLCPVLVGRDAELSTVEDALLSALRGDGGVVMVGGEAGMGKTRLVRALAARANTLGCVVVSGACSEAELALPYLPFLEAIGNYLAKADLAPLRARLGPAAEELAQLFPQMGRPASAAGDAGQAKLRLFESMLLLLRDAAGSRALMLILEDLQWADPATRELLDYATRRLRSTNVLIVATYRTDEMHRRHALLPTIQGWRRSGQVEVVELKALDGQGIADMVCRIFDEATITDEFRDFLHDRSEGNPFVLEEMLRDAIDRGDVFRTETGWDRRPLAEMRIPPTVKEAILQRLERLAPQHVTVLSAASVVGRSFDLATVAAVTGIDGDSVLSALEGCAAAQLIEEEDQASGRYRFRHALTQEAVYEDMVGTRRRQLHSRVADHLASGGDRIAVDLANHLLLAGRYEEAVTMCVAAAGDAARQHAYRDAAELLERAAPHVGEPMRRAQMLCEAGTFYWQNAETANARRLLEQGIDDLEHGERHREAATHRLVLGRCLWELLRSDLAREQYERALKELEPAGPSEALAVAYIRIAGLDIFDDHYGPGLENAKHAAQVAEAAGSSMARAWSWNFMALGEIGLGEVTSGFRLLEDSFQAATTDGHQFQAGNAVYNAVWTAIELGAGERLDAWAARIEPVRAADPDSAPPYLAALLAINRGHLIDAIPLARLAVQRASEAGHQKQVWRSQILLAHALTECMRPEEAARVMPPISSRVEVQDANYHTTALVRFELARGNRRGAFEDAKTVPRDSCHLASPVHSVAEAADDPAWLRSFIEALPVRGEVRASPRMSTAKGWLALLEGRHRDALEALGSADADLRRGGLLLDAWHQGRGLARAEFHVGEVDAARLRLRGIVSEAESLGALLGAKLARETAESLGLEVGSMTDGAADAPTPPRIATGERMVTVLFADVRGYTQMAGRAAPAEVADRVAALHRWATQEVTRRQGLVDKFAGDAIMATFNISGQTVDHSLQALRAAIGIIDKAALAGLPVGAGLAVGPAVVGSLVDAANVSVLGDVTNLAARLQASSAAGEVTLSEEAFRRVRIWLDDQKMVARQVQLELKGFAEPVVAYQVKTAVGVLPAAGLGTA
ncbi:MAG TPA: AAA family ATPase [Candidatus Dormibacteraeota bacterium]|nr:AAA family ATPase [Candidatus Dormibacteraeota bacterium]